MPKLKETPQLSIYRLTPEKVQEIEEKEKEQSAVGSIPKVYDYSTLSAFKGCPRKGFFSYTMHLKPRRFAKPLIFGSAVHAALETFNKAYAPIRKQMLKAKADVHIKVLKKLRHMAAEKFLEVISEDPEMPPFKSNEPPRIPYSAERGLELVDQYIIHNHEHPLWVLEDAENSEIGFSISVGEYMFVGKLDMLVRSKITGQLAVVDYKTATRKDATWDGQWNPHDQLTGYMYATSQLTGESVRQAYIHCLHFNKKICDVNHIVPTTRSELDMIEWEQETSRVIHHIEEMYNEWRFRCKQEGIDYKDSKAVLASSTITSYPKNTQHCEFWRKPCEYTDSCMSGRLKQRSQITHLQNHYKPWMPFNELDTRGTGVID